METNWNQLIERYLQNELSDEGKMAFEQELQVNPELREELELHQLIQSAAKRASQRTIIQQTGKSYLRNLRIKQFMITVFVAAAATVGLVYLVQNKKDAGVAESKSPAVAVNSEEVRKETDIRDTIINQPAPTGDKSSLIQSSDWNTVEDQARNTTSFKSNIHKNEAVNPLKRVGIANSGQAAKHLLSLAVDSLVPPGKPTEVVLGYTDKKPDEEAVTQYEDLKLSKQYDSIGKFNDLYCGYALVMDQQKFGFIDYRGNEFIPLMYDEIVVTSNIKSSKNKRKGHFGKKQKRKVLYIPKRSGKDVRDCEEEYIRLERNSDSLK
ncbi:MAG: hypothetical protein K0S23_1008 [Fluviicola sp.]|jgi:hypothetical protein|uniref:hypothetical protein n=1 Tax=Fluviicola sp. TaxID=1917219 RepID=UPI00260A6626|nr:hypothetical protein [Fluviicola sp.]MDF3026701.1 hypothetical protein [Fluviicola sp.]